MAIDAWTNTPQEKRWRQRAKNWEATKGDRRKSLGGKAKTKYQDVRDGTSRCGCGCGKTGTMFRGGRLYNSGCVNKSSEWGRSKLPQDRTPPTKYGGKKWVSNA